MNGDDIMFWVVNVGVLAFLLPIMALLYHAWRDRRQTALKSGFVRPPMPSVPKLLEPELRPVQEVNSKRIIDRLPEAVKAELIDHIQAGVPYQQLVRDLRRHGYRISEQCLGTYAREVLGTCRRITLKRVNNKELPHD